ncbi:AEC family transporter [Pokkaliibacter sp. CJK22405]|uniref:AEC family transporter n=1 Tax=Pokkaliibacter sp. CJK22405 TaxID=3384615 RepID=UPI003984D47C
MVTPESSLYWSTLIFTGEMVAPIFFLVFLGIVLIRYRIIDEAFINTASRLVFMVCLPLLVFFSISQTNIREVFDLATLAFAGISVFLTYVGATVWARWKGYEKADEGAFVQGSFRSNYGIIGLAISFNLFGQPGLGQASIVLALVIPLFNVLSIIALSVSQPGSRSWGKTMIQILKNPLIIATVVALPVSAMGIHMPEVISKTGHTLSSMTLPLALLTIGASLNLKDLRASSGITFHASVFKLIWMPLVFTPLAWLLGFTGMQTAILFVMLGSPTAAASFVMAKNMGANAKLAASIILVTTLGSIITMSTGIYLLRLWGII